MRVCHRYFPHVFVLQGLDRPKFSDTIFQRLNIFQVLISLTYFVFCRLKQFHSDKVECVDSPLSVCCNFSALQSRALGCSTTATQHNSNNHNSNSRVFWFMIKCVSQCLCWGEGCTWSAGLTLSLKKQSCQIYAMILRRYHR